MNTFHYKSNSFKILTVSIITPILLGCSNYKPNDSAETDLEDSIVVQTEFVDTIYEETIDYLQEDNSNETDNNQSLASKRYRQKQEEVHIADIHVMYEDGKKIWYNYWTSETQSGFSNMLYEYDSETDRESIINLNKTNEDEFYVDDMACNNGIITIIMSEFRNSNGWLEGTFVWQYNCETGSWKPLAKACSGAKFVNNRRSVKIDNAYCINPDEPTFLQEYRHRYKTIKL